MITTQLLWKVIDRVTTLIALVCGGAVIWSVASGRATLQGGAQAGRTQVATPMPPDTLTELAAHSIVIGHPSTAIVEFGDYQCPSCAAYATTTYKLIKEAFIDTGKLAYDFRNYPLQGAHPLAIKGSQIAECAAKEGRYWPTSERLFEKAIPTSQAGLVDFAEAVGVDLAKLMTCMDGPTVAAIDADKLEGKRLSVAATPTFFIGKIGANGHTVQLTTKIVGAPPFGVFKTVIQKAIDSGE